MRVLLLIVFFLAAMAGYSQKVIDVGKQDVRISSSMFYIAGGEPVSTAKYVKVVAGSPYFNESWIRGKVTMSRGAVYDSVWLRLDLLDNSFQYVGPDGRELVAASSAVRSLILPDSATNEKYEFDQSVFLQATNKIETGWYQLLADGQAALYKRFVKTVSEDRPYGSATVEQTIITSTRYYVFVNAIFTRIKKFKDIPQLLQDKKDELDKYISNKNLSGRSDADYISMIDYYNSLIEK